MSGLNLKAIKVLNALAFGQEVELDGRLYSMGEYVEGGYGLNIKGKLWRNGQKPFVDEGEDTLLCADDTRLVDFLNMCEKVNDDDLFILAAERALTKINRGE